MQEQRETAQAELSESKRRQRDSGEGAGMILKEEKQKKEKKRQKADRRGKIEKRGNGWGTGSSAVPANEERRKREMMKHKMQQATD